MKFGSLVLLLMLSARFASATEFTFSSKLDRFTVEVSDGSASFEGQIVPTEPFAYIKPLFDAQFVEDCDKGLGRPDLTISRKRGENEEKRLVFIDKKIVSDGKFCGEVSGHGLYQLPLHRNWFTGKKNVTIGLGSSFSIWKNNLLVVEFEKHDGLWHNKDPKFFTNWDFFEKFARSVKDFSVDFRVHPSAAKTMTTFELRQGARKFVFVKVGEQTWAVQFPGSPWFAASGKFGLFEEMDQKIWISPFSKILEIVKDPTAASENRIKAIRSLADRWGSDAKMVFFDVLLTDGENFEVKKEIANLMRSRPTDENFKTLVDALRTSTDRQFQYTLSKILRVRNPKGPIIEEEDDKSLAAKKISDWVNWRKSLK